MDEIEELAVSLQSGNPRVSQPPSNDSVRILRQRYLDWYARARAKLNDAGKQTLQKYYSGPGFAIHTYLGDPGGTTYSSSRGGYKQSSGAYQWTYKCSRYFKEPFDEQRLLLMRVEASTRVRESSPPQPPPPPAFDTIRLHSRVRAVSAKLFKDDHYRQAILQACIALNEAVQQRSGRSDIDGTKLMQKVFSNSHPILKFEGHPDEQQGFMWLYSGVVMGIRNPRGHQVGESEDLDANEALEILALISFLFRALDASITVPSAPTTP